MSRIRAVAAGAALLAVLAGGAVTGCAATPVGPAPPPARPSYQLPPETVRPSETVLRPAPATDGDTTFALIGLTTGLPSVLGSHAEWPAKGRFARIRLMVTNNGRTSVPFDTARQLLITADGAQHIPDSQAMLIKRQPGRIDVGAGDRLEFDLYYDIAPDARPMTLRAFGGATLSDFSDATGVDIPVGG